MSEEHISLNQIIQFRLEKLQKLRDGGINPYPYNFKQTHFSNEIKQAFDSLENKDVVIAGRIMSMRKMGKASFCHIQDGEGRIQSYIRRDDVGEEAYSNFKLLDIGDYIGIKGYVFKTKTEEISVHASELTILSKSIRPLPVVKEKDGEIFDAFSDKEQRYRNRHLDLIVNPDVKEVFVKRAKIISSVRKFLDDKGFLEVETPVLQPLYGGANARPFTTHHNSLDQDLYLRIADELYLKRLIIGGIDKVYELSKNFRNEGMDRNHNPEFTMLEAYQAYGDYETMMELLQSMICHVSDKVCGTLVIEQRDADGNVTQTIDLTPDWRRAKYKDLIREKAGDNWFDLTPGQRRARATGELQIEIDPNEQDFEVTNAVFEKLVEPTLIQPTFVTHLPKELVPLAKLSPDEPDCVEVFECCINGQEIAPAYTEQNNPIEQRERLEQQAGGEQQKLDEDFLVALEHGMPPAGGIGIGIDRLIMMLLGQESIRDVLLFPQLKPKPTAAE